MIWSACNGIDHIKPIAGTLYRLVESQEQVATMGYVETLEEQVLLEEMLEQAKPTYADGIEAFHYLLTTPFRYPPLQWGSRFGKINEPSLFYAGGSPSVALAESAFYRFVFLDSIEGVSEKDKIRSEHTLFSVNYQTEIGLQLQRPPFNDYRAELTHPSDYSHAQQLGSKMRSAGVGAFEYESARALNNTICVALFNTSPFVQNTPQQMEQWLCETSLSEVSFKPLGENSIVHFSITDFLINGSLPLPA